jgi:hypothetical protein
MQKLADGRWLYSPVPSEDYTDSGAGPGAWVGGDLAKWNLLWLTFGDELESARQGSITFAKLIHDLSPEKIGIVMACARVEMEDLFPGLSEALVGPLPLFIHVFKSGPVHYLPAHNEIAGWRDIVLSNAEKLRNEKCDLDDTFIDLRRAEVRVNNNVIEVKFGKS